MNTHSKWIVLVGVLAAAPAVLADPPKQPGNTATAPMTGERKALMRQLREEREKMVRERGEVFAKITTKHDYTGEYVLFRDQDVTAFLDIKDPKHPRYKAGHDDEEEAGGAKNLSHVLVVPNQPRETIGKTIASDITADDLELTMKVMREATALATKLGVKSPRIYVRSPARVGVGYLHVHIVGERDPKAPYPPPLK
jgi:diadenosine tetraphosphate (Ap4A) HIT family hydrolase